MRGGGGVRLLSLLAGGLQTYPHSLTIKLPYVTKNFYTFPITLNIFYNIKIFISRTLTSKPTIFKNFIYTNFYIFYISFSYSFFYSFIYNSSRTSNLSSSLIFNKPLNIKKKTRYNLL